MVPAMKNEPIADQAAALRFVDAAMEFLAAVREFQLRKADLDVKVGEDDHMAPTLREWATAVRDELEALIN